MISKEFKIFVMTKKDIDLKDCGYVLARAISGAMAKDDELLDMHRRGGFKLYSFDYLYPLAEDNTYQKGRIYTFRLRSVDEKFISKIKSLLCSHEDENLKVLIVEENAYKQRPIKELISLTPVVCTLEKMDNGRLNINKLADIQNEIISVLVKKYNSFAGEKLSLSDASHIFKLSKVASKPISFNYKDISLIGIKYRFEVAEDSLSQNLAYFAEVNGLGEKCSSCGAGFAHAIYDKVGVSND